MNSVLISIKKFFTNKNVVTILGVIAILFLLFFGYNKTIENQVRPTKVPVAAKTIEPREKITDDMVTYISVPASSINKNVIRKDIVGKVANVNSVIPEGSMFFEGIIIDEDELPNYAFKKVKEGQRPYALSVTVDSTYGNSIFPDDIIDVYMKAENEEGEIMIGRLLAKIDVLAVKDSEGKNVFESTSETRRPDNLLFGVPEDVFILLKKAEYLNGLGVELFPVPYGSVPPTGDLKVDRTELVEYIESHTVNFPDNVEEDTNNQETENQDLDNSGNE